MTVYKLNIPILEFSEEHIKAIFSSTGQAVQDLADVSLLFSQIFNAYISRTKAYFENPSYKFCRLNSCSKRVKFGNYWSSRFQEKRVTD